MQNQKEIARLADHLEDLEVAMLTTVDEDGMLRSRPMIAQKRRFDGTLWFFTRLGDPKSHEVQEDQRVNVVFCDPGRSRYVSVSGEGEISRDADRIRELWDPTLSRWFPAGPDDPDLVLLKVDVRCAEYWDEGSWHENRKLDLAG